MNYLMTRSRFQFLQVSGNTIGLAFYKCGLEITNRGDSGGVGQRFPVRATLNGYCRPANAKILSDLSSPVSVTVSPNEEKGIQLGNSTRISLYDPWSGRSSLPNGVPTSTRFSISGYPDLVVSQTGVCWSRSCAVWNNKASGMSNPSDISGIPGVNTFWVLVSSVISFPRGVPVVPETDLLAGPLNIPTDCELLVFLPELDAFFVFSMESAVSAFEIQGWCDEIILRWELGCVQWVQRVPLVAEVLVFAEILRSRSVTWILTRM